MAVYKKILITSLVFALALGKPTEKEPIEDDFQFAQKRAVDVINESSSMFSNYREAAITGGGVFLIAAGLGLAVYNFYYLKYVQASEAGKAQDYQMLGGYPQQFGRSLQAADQWNFTTVLEYIDVAQKTYQGFDYQDKECQKRTLCELAQNDSSLKAEAGRQLNDSSLSSLVDLVRGLPVPQVIQAYLQEYSDAVAHGTNSKTPCGEVYPSCKFSINKVLKDASSEAKTESS